MLPAKQAQSHPTIEYVQELFEEWRRRKKRRDPIPPSLWDAAVTLTDRHSIYRISRHLGLNFNELKARALRPAPSFIELAVAPCTGHIECSVEMEKPTGERMRIRGSCNLAELAREFWKA
jgi:hypothetical protein